MTTRLDRLFLLLETGSTPVIRKSAAEQLGEVQRLHPHEFHNLLSKVYGYLVSEHWETRIAAGQAVDAIARNIPVWDPSPAVKKEDEDASSCSSGAPGQLEFRQFDIGKVLFQGASLLASEGAEYDMPTDIAFANQREYLAQQKQLLNKKLGLDVAGGLGISSDDLYQEDDLLVEQQQMTPHSNGQSGIKDVVQQQAHGVKQFDLSSREKNRAKRRAKMTARRTSKDPEKNGEGSDSEPAVKKRKTTSVVTDQPCQDNKVVVDSVPDNTLDLDQLTEWPFESFCDLLMNDLFHPCWERRHGAATGLREVLKLHASGAGKCSMSTALQMESDHQHWLEDMSLRLICVLALDRFGDFVSDEVVAPVRETCAQTLGLVVRHLTPEGVASCGRVLLQLLTQAQWEVRHGGLLGIKYLLAVRQDLVKQQIPLLTPSVLGSLQDKDDDVRAVAAAALLPITDALISQLTSKMSEIVECLWFTLLDLDDLTASTSSIMSLLATILAHPSVHPQQVCSQSLTELVPRLWPFFKHNILSVRMSALQTLYTLLEQPKDVHSDWIFPILPDTMRHLYQRCLLEEKQDILQMIYKVWTSLLSQCSTESIVMAACPWLGVWLCLLMQPPSLPFDNQLLIDAEHHPKANHVTKDLLGNKRTKELTPSRLRHAEHLANKASGEHKEYIGGFHSLNQPHYERDQTVIRARINASRLLGVLCGHMCRPVSSSPEGVETPLESLSRLFCFHLSTKSALQRLAVALVIYHWAFQEQRCECPDEVRTKLLECLGESIYYDEIALAFARLQTEARNLQASLKQQGADTSHQVPMGCVLTLEQIQALSTTVFEAVKDKLRPRYVKDLEDRSKQLAASVAQTMMEQQALTTRVQCCLASAVVYLKKLPEKLNPVIRPLMDALKKEDNSQIQTVVGSSLSQLLLQCVLRDPSPNAKIIKNTCTMLCGDPQHTPHISLQPCPSTSTSDSAAQSSDCDKYSGIITLNAQLKVNERVVRGRGATRKLAAATALNTDLSMEALIHEDDENRKQLLIQRRGATLALTTSAVHAGAALPTTLPQLWETMMSTLAAFTDTDLASFKDNDEKSQEFVNSLQVMETVTPSLHEQLHAKVLEELEKLCACLQHPYSAVRHMAARCVGMLSKLDTTRTMNVTLEALLPLLAAPDNEIKRQGAVESLANMIEQLGMDLVPYIVLLVVPLLGRMSDQNEHVRLMATHCFATLIKLMPLEAGIADPPDMKPSLIERKEQQREFLEQLLDNSKVSNYTVPVPVKADLRKYQQDGVNWLAFLNKYSLHGILCDDMGLGKTLQSICMMAGDHYLRKLKYQENAAADCVPLPSLVVCPPTLTGHWVYEIDKFVSSEHLNPLHYTGPPSERTRLQKHVKRHNVVVASYDVVRNDIDFFGKQKWNYCILDEGHIIKNSKTKLFKAVRQLQVNHRLILSGTPIQNNVLELWSLFDFLMPGYLGTERQFQARYGKPILQSRDAKSSSKEQEAGALAMEALHRQVLPFVLRRMKEDVLKDLPPKIIQDYYCDLSPLQVQLYEDFAKSRAKRSVEETITQGSPEKESKNKQHQHATHIFQALQYLRKVCNHPALVLKPQHPKYEEVCKQLRSQQSSVRDLQHAPKLTALKQLLQDCGIGVAESGSDSGMQPVVGQHRVLLFCQLKGMLDIVENDLLKAQMPSVTYLRLDGSVPAGSRHGVVNRFNEDPSIDMLLLTTHVGGLGLNLTGADTVIFVEHDWNPMKDLQAMDRAHRIGQKKVVNVYRLISRGTLEEKIMGLQKFKLNIANTVISQENASLASMGTDQLLDLFSLEEKPGDKDQSQGSTQSGMKGILENLEELWDESQYESEYDMENFMKALNK